MSDDLDAANDLAQAERDAGIAAVRAASKTRIQLTGFCLHCAEITKKLFCDAECGIDYEYTQKLLRIKGLRSP